ncbi:fusaric acid resistance protein FusB [Gluconobacter thailandicus]|uniref:FUSC family protein n=1 Tax=Gluconobacter thailandicus TaxID=257438 RepID=UPI000776B1D7|nr:FUSC family protein [Gluconobacter thailandicus]KXV35927.1 fusaric acid resistance protein FusB [Gluconobacter thailandicus]
MSATVLNNLQRRKLLWFSDARWAEFLKTSAFTLRVCLSVGLALLVAFVVQLDSPMSTVTTVVIVAHPLVGALISKSVWRVLGTVVGAGLSVGIMGCFVQSAWLYFIALALLVGLACMTASLLRLYRAYAAVLTGYTIIIVAFAAFSHPETVFMSAMMRLSDVVVGVVSTAVVFMVTCPRRSTSVYQALNDAFLAVLQHAHSFHGNQASVDMIEGAAFRALPEELYDSRQAVLKKLTVLTPLLEYAASDNPDIKDHLSSYKMAVNRMAGVVASYHPHWKNLHRPHAQFRGLHSYTAQILDEILDAARDQNWIENPEKILYVLEGGIKSLIVFERDESLTPESRATVENIQGLFRSLRRIVEDLSEKKSRAIVRVSPYLEWPTAIRNGARGTLITLLACFIWYVTAWPTGPMMMMYVIAASSLLSTVPSASKGSTAMAIGTVFSIPATWLYHVYILPQIDGYGLLWVSLCLFLLPGIWLQFHPKYSIGAFGYAVFFAVQSLVTNEMIYDDIALTNTWMAVICGAVLLVLVFRVLLPPNHASDAMMIMKALRKSVNALTRASTRHLPNPEQWQGDQIQKLSRLAIKLSFLDQKTTARSLLDQAFSLVSLGKLILELRQKAGNPFEEKIVQMFLYDTVLRSQMVSYESLGNDGLVSNIDQIKFILKHIGNK